MCLEPLMVLTFTDETAQAGSSTGMSLRTIRNRGVEQHGADRPTQVPARTVGIHRVAIVHELVHRRLPAAYNRWPVKNGNYYNVIHACATVQLLNETTSIHCAFKIALEYDLSPIHGA